MDRFRIDFRYDPSRVMYLILHYRDLKKYSDLARIRPNEKFFEWVQSLVIDHATDGKVPEQIAPAIMNISDDMMAGRDVVLRAGDYISLMNFAKDNKIIK